MVYWQEAPLSFDHPVANPSDGTTQPATAGLLTNTAQNATTLSYKTNPPELAKTIQNSIQNAKKNTNSIIIPKNLLWFKTQTVSIPNRRCSASFNQKYCNPRAQETGRPFCWPWLRYSQDRTLRLQIRLTFKSSSLFCLPYLPAEAITSVTGGAMAFGHQHSTTMPTEANFKKKAQKVQKIRRIWR